MPLWDFLCIPSSEWETNLVLWTTNKTVPPFVGHLCSLCHPWKQHSACTSLACVNGQDLCCMPSYFYGSSALHCWGGTVVHSRLSTGLTKHYLVWFQLPCLDQCLPIYPAPWYAMCDSESNLLFITPKSQSGIIRCSFGAVQPLLHLWLTFITFLVGFTLIGTLQGLGWKHFDTKSGCNNLHTIPVKKDSTGMTRLGSVNWIPPRCIALSNALTCG